ncbi:MAG: YggU family protein [Desulfuromonadales bacterium C00003107]|nr:MAG: YggU family protein [Desulfuromonadales bacterium C00003107]
MKRIEIKVIPNSNKNEIIEAEPLTVRVKDPPIKGKANKTVVGLLSRYFNANVRIISGSKSRRKIVEIEEPDEGMRKDE